MAKQRDGAPEGGSEWVYVVQLAVRADVEDVFNELYQEHIDYLMEVPGVRSCTRYRLDWADTDDMPEYLAIYEVDGPDVPNSDAWKRQSQLGDWPARVRPALTVRRHGMHRRI